MIFKSTRHFKKNNIPRVHTQLPETFHSVITCSKLTIEILEQGLKYVQS